MATPPHDAELIILANQTLGKIEGRLWGQFIELAGRCINGGIYDPDSPHARPDGTRADVFEAMRELQPTHIRYPGGCATAYFDWQELVGPREQRPRNKLFRGLGQSQSTAFGIPEAYGYAKELGAELYLTVNAHTQSPEDAANLVEYLNGTGPTKYADLRRSHGREEPYNVKLFGLGNEIYGDWQPGQKTAAEYVAWCRRAIQEMKLVDPAIDIVCVGLGRPGPEWDRIVLKGLIDRIDMISVHNYCGRPVFRDCMAAFRVYEEMFNWLDVAVDEAMDTLLTRKKRPGFAFDEWNVWYRSKHGPVADLEETYDYADAMTVASLFHVMLRNTRSVTLSNISLAVNTCGSIFTDKMRCVRQTIFYPQKLFRAKHSGRAVRTVVECPQFAAKHERFFCGIVDVEKAKDENLPTLLKFDDVPALDVMTSIDEKRGRMSISVLNKLEEHPLRTALTFRGVKPNMQRVKVHRMTGNSIAAVNTLDSPNNVGLETQTTDLDGAFTFPPASLTLLEFTL
ncbi:MAG: hypothetical protein K8S99_06970 [Planctomycetes bacterium]|nr:hypothetical protein [Planctomycetota bacterium]